MAISKAAIILATLSLAATLLPGNSLLQTVATPLFFPVGLTALALGILFSFFQKAKFLKSVFFLIAALWILQSYSFYSLRQPEKKIAAEQSKRIVECLSDTNALEGEDFFAGFEPTNLLEIKKYSELVYSVTVRPLWSIRNPSSLTWSPKDFFVQSIVLRRFSKFLRHDDKPYVIMWNAEPSLFDKQLPAMLFQARLEVMGEVGSKLVLGRNDISAIESLEGCDNKPLI